MLEINPSVKIKMLLELYLLTRKIHKMYNHIILIKILSLSIKMVLVNMIYHLILISHINIQNQSLAGQIIKKKDSEINL
jgi:hypothetical protein